MGFRPISLLLVTSLLHHHSLRNPLPAATNMPPSRSEPRTSRLNPITRPGRVGVRARTREASVDDIFEFRFTGGTILLDQAYLGPGTLRIDCTRLQLSLRVPQTGARNRSSGISLQAPSPPRYPSPEATLSAARNRTQLLTTSDEGRLTDSGSTQVNTPGTLVDLTADDPATRLAGSSLTQINTPRTLIDLTADDPAASPKCAQCTSTLDQGYLFNSCGCVSGAFNILTLTNITRSGARPVSLLPKIIATVPATLSAHNISTADHIRERAISLISRLSNSSSFPDAVYAGKIVQGCRGQPFGSVGILFISLALGATITREQDGNTEI